MQDGIIQQASRDYQPWAGRLFGLTLVAGEV